MQSRKRPVLVTSAFDGPHKSLCGHCLNCRKFRDISKAEIDALALHPQTTLDALERGYRCRKCGHKSVIVRIRIDNVIPGPHGT